MTKKFILTLMTLLLIFVAIFGMYFYDDSKSYQWTRTTCEAYEISRIVNNYYSKQGYYPSKSDIYPLLLEKSETIKCGRKFIVDVRKGIFNATGEPYLIAVEPDSFEIRSITNGHLVKLTSENGEIKWGD